MQPQCQAVHVAQHEPGVTQMVSWSWLIDVQWSCSHGHCDAQKERCSGDCSFPTYPDAVVQGGHEGAIIVINNKMRFLLHNPV